MKTDNIEKVITMVHQVADAGFKRKGIRYDGAEFLDTCHVAQTELAALKDTAEGYECMLGEAQIEIKKLRAFHAVAPQPGWFKALYDGNRPAGSDPNWLIDYADKYAAALPEGEG